jgi:hypothetical protein
VARVHLLSAASSQDPDPKAFLDLEQMRAAAAADRFGVHSVVVEPGDADLILFVETSTAAGSYFERVRRHPVYRRHRERSYLFSSTDRVVALLPGVYASIERRWYREAWTRSGHYLGVKERPGLAYDAHSQPSLLFSFVGNGAAHPVRRRILALAHPHALLADSAAATATTGADRYTESIRSASFVLCPRGGGVSSFRLFETMMLGRVPVVVSDPWVAPEGPDWDRFSVRIAERDVAQIPALLEERAAEASAMGAAARAEWLDWFSPEVSFHRTVQWCLELAEHAGERSGARRFVPRVQMLRPYHAARWGATLARRLRPGSGG